MPEPEKKEAEKKPAGEEAKAGEKKGKKKEEENELSEEDAQLQKEMELLVTRAKDPVLELLCARRVSSRGLRDPLKKTESFSTNPETE